MLNLRYLRAVISLRAIAVLAKFNSAMVCLLQVHRQRSNLRFFRFHGIFMLGLLVPSLLGYFHGKSICEDSVGISAYHVTGIGYPADSLSRG